MLACVNITVEIQKSRELGDVGPKKTRTRGSLSGIFHKTMTILYLYLLCIKVISSVLCNYISIAYITMVTYLRTDLPARSWPCHHNFQPRFSPSGISSILSHARCMTLGCSQYWYYLNNTPIIPSKPLVSFHHLLILLGGWALPLWKIMECSSVGMMLLFPTEWKVIQNSMVPNHQPGYYWPLVSMFCFLLFGNAERYTTGSVCQ